MKSPEHMPLVFVAMHHGKESDEKHHHIIKPACQSIGAVCRKKFGTFKKIGALSKNINVLDYGVSTKVFLMPAGKGCVSIKKEIVR